MAFLGKILTLLFGELIKQLPNFLKEMLAHTESVETSDGYLEIEEDPGVLFDVELAEFDGLHG